jgi:hypothetical protein
LLLLLLCCAAGDKLFRVVERKELPPSPTGSRRVEVVNKAAIRVLAWKLWSKSNVIYEIKSGNSGGFESCIGQCSSRRMLAKSQQQQQQQEEEEEGERVSFELVSSVSALKG